MSTKKEFEVYSGKTFDKLDTYCLSGVELSVRKVLSTSFWNRFIFRELYSVLKKCEKSTCFVFYYRICREFVTYTGNCAAYARKETDELSVPSNYFDEIFKEMIDGPLIKSFDNTCLLINALKRASKKAKNAKYRKFFKDTVVYLEEAKDNLNELGINMEMLVEYCMDFLKETDISNKDVRKKYAGKIQPLAEKVYDNIVNFLTLNDGKKVN